MRTRALIAGAILAGCVKSEPLVAPQVVPAVEYSRAVQQGTERTFSILRTGGERFRGDNHYLDQGYLLRTSLQVPTAVSEADLIDGRAALEPRNLQILPPPGSRAPYTTGQMRSNPSLWPDEGSSNFLYRDVRAFQPMDVVTIVINERSEGRKKSETDTESKFSLLLAIENLLGIETKTWASNNDSLDPANLVNATTESKFEGDGETKRSGALSAKISAVVLEVLPNGLLRVEGTKIVSVDREEEVMVISGLIRPRDISADNQIDSSRVANMRIDFYGRGVIGDTTSPGWLARAINKVWPF